MPYQLIPLNGDAAFAIGEGEVVVGRSSSECGLVVKGAHISKRHARLIQLRDELQVIDLGSCNGTWLNGARIQSAAVRSGDELAFGSSRFRVEVAVTVPQSAVEETAVASNDIASDQSATVVSLDALDEFLARASHAADDVGSSLAEFERAKAARLAPAEIGQNVAARDSVPTGLPPAPIATSIEVTDDNSPSATETVAVTPTQNMATVTTAPERRLWRPNSKPTRTPARQSGWSARSDAESASWLDWMKSHHRIVLAAATVILVLSGAPFLFGNRDDETIELCERLHQELIDRRKRGQTNDPAWQTVCQQNVEKLKAIAKRLNDAADSSQPRRQNLLYAVKYELPVMLTPGPHWKSVLTPDAQKLEEVFAQHLKIARGELDPRDIFKPQHGRAPPEPALSGNGPVYRSSD